MKALNKELQQFKRILLFLIYLLDTVFCQNGAWRINLGGSALMEQGWTQWDQTSGFTVVSDGQTGVTPLYYATDQVRTLPIGEGYSQELYATQLTTYDPSMSLVFNVTPGTNYRVKLHFMEFSHTENKQRQISIKVGQQTVADKFDIIYNVKGTGRAIVKTYDTTAMGTLLTIKLTSIVGSPAISAIELYPYNAQPQTQTQPVSVTPPENLAPPEYLVPPTQGTGQIILSKGKIEFGDVPLGSEVAQTVVLTAAAPMYITAVQFLEDDVTGGFEFSYNFTGRDVFRGGLNYKFMDPIVVGPEGMALTISFSPKSTKANQYRLQMVMMSGKAKVATLYAIGNGDAADIQQGHTLHPIISTPPYAVFVDWDGDGEEKVSLSSFESHTHGPGREIVYEDNQWFDEQDKIASTGLHYNATHKVGVHSTILLIYDNEGDAAAVQQEFTVAPPDKVPGSYIRYFQNVESLSRIPKKASWARIAQNITAYSHPYFTFPIGITISGRFYLKEKSTLKLTPVPEGLKTQIMVNGKKYKDGSKVKGEVSVVVKVIAMSPTLLEPPPNLVISNSNVKDAVPEGIVHDQLSVQPVLTELVPKSASSMGGQLITLRGIGFNNLKATIFVNGIELPTSAIKQIAYDLDGIRITFTAPANPVGMVKVHIETDNDRVSNMLDFEYISEETFSPVRFVNTQFKVPSSSTAVVYCFDYIFMAIGSSSRKGGDFSIYQYSLSEDYSSITLVKELTAVRNATSNGYVLDTILGLTCDPWGTEKNFDVYATVNAIYPDGGGLSGEAESALLPPGAVVRLNSAEDFEILHYVIVNLATSNYDHALNGIEFTMDGQLLIASGSPTNAGLPHPELGSLEDGPLTGGILVAPVHQTGFQGTMQYSFLPGAPVDSTKSPMDMRYQGWTQVDGGDVRMFATGMRNPYDLELCPTDLKMYVTDNGPNALFGGRMFGLNDQKNGKPYNEEDSDGEYDPGNQMDKLLLLEQGNYYGHCNLARARSGDEQQAYCYLATEIVGNFTSHVAVLDSSSDGITCYRAEAFNGGAKGDLFIQAYTKGYQQRVIREDGQPYVIEADTDDANRPTTSGLSIAGGPGGTLLVAQHSCKDEDGCKLIVQVPDDDSVKNGKLTLYQIDPWRAPAAGGGKFVVSGANFGEKGCSVQVGGVEAQVTYQSNVRIAGVLPPLEASMEAYGVSVTCGEASGKLEAHYYALFKPVGAE